MSANLDIHTLAKSIRKWFLVLHKYQGLIFFLLLTSLYGYIVWRINVLSTAPPSTSDVANAQQNVSSPRIPESTIKTLQGLQDNSVRVQAIFNEARSNPFQE
jgi:hypothetical protein